LGARAGLYGPAIMRGIQAKLPADGPRAGLPVGDRALVYLASVGRTQRVAVKRTRPGEMGRRSGIPGRAAYR